MAGAGGPAGDGSRLIRVIVGDSHFILDAAGAVRVGEMLIKAGRQGLGQS